MLIKTAKNASRSEPTIDSNDLLSLAARYDRWTYEDPLESATLRTPEPLIAGTYTPADIADLAAYFSNVRELTPAERSHLEDRLLMRASAFERPR